MLIMNFAFIRLYRARNDIKRDRTDGERRRREESLFRKLRATDPLPLSIRQPQPLRQLQRRNPTGIRHRNHHIHLLAPFLQLSPHLERERVAHGHAGAIDADAVEDGVRPGEIDVFEDVGGEGGGRGDLAA